MEGHSTADPTATTTTPTGATTDPTASTTDTCGPVRAESSERYNVLCVQ